MSVILLVLGILVGAAGIATIGFGIPINEFALGTTLIMAGTTALVGGLILLGLSAVISELGRLAEALKSRPVARPAVARAGEVPEPAVVPTSLPTPMATAPTMGPRPSQANVLPPRSMPPLPMREPARPEPLPAGSNAVEVSAAAIERLRSSIPRTERPKVEPQVEDTDAVTLSPNGPVHQAAPQPPEPKVAADDPAAGSAVEALKASRLDFLFRSKPASRSAPPQPENFDTFWPADGRSGRSIETEPQARVDSVERQADPAQPLQDRRSDPVTIEEPRASAILKSGVVDGMAYTLYADGSIEAKLPHGTVRFGSITELRAHIETNS